ncbi:MAG TPA: cation-transporting P-type ATPase [Gaiellaceae bacterium]|nr:cation-transporting P-type ATPase [Gaiellaceae bacterium]
MTGALQVGVEPSPARGGLSSEEAGRRLAEIGPNAIAEEKPPSHVRRLLAQLVHLFALLLWTGAALALVAGMPQLSVAIVVVVLVNAGFAFAQEYRAERAADALRRMLPQDARVRRDGEVVVIAAEELVPGDVLVLDAGERVTGDAELLDAVELRVDNSTLTGESWPVSPEGRVFAGTYVVSGRAEALVTATGMQTEFGRIAELTQRAHAKPSPLELELKHVTRLVAVVSTGIGTAFFLVGGALGMGLEERFVFAVGVMVANVPEGLLPTVTLALALATQRMARRNALVRRLSSVETLGETTVICTDKTGTITENELTVVRVWTPELEIDVEGAGYEPFGRFRSKGRVVQSGRIAELLRAGLLCNDSRLLLGADGWSVRGDPTEGALVVLAGKCGLRQEQETAHFPRVHEVPFDSGRRRMTTVHLGGTGRIAYVKGAPEEILRRSRLEPAELRLAEEAAAAMEADALRVLALARKTLPDIGPLDGAELEEELEFLGLVGMLDPPRPEVPGAIARCHAAGIRVVMVTGDAGPTAEAIARRIGLVRRRAHVITGAELDRIDDDRLRRLLTARDVVFARIDPEQKLRLARVLREAGEVVAMTGDGVNDAPALREADIGVAMGRRGTDVAKEAADMILLDDNFATVVAAVEEGRAVYDNIRRFTVYHFCSNVGELLPFVVWGISGGAIPLPLTVMQVLAIDLGTDMLPAIALGTEPAEPGTMTRPPRPRGERLLGLRVLSRAYGFVGLIEGVAGLTGFLLSFLLGGWRPGTPLPSSGAAYVQATTMTQTGIVMGQVGAGMAMRTNRRSVFSIGLFSNRFLLVAIAFELGLAAALIYVPGLNSAFHQAPIGLPEWLYLATVPFVVFGAEEARKAVVRRRGRSQRSATAIAK